MGAAGAGRRALKVVGRWKLEKAGRWELDGNKTERWELEGPDVKAAGWAAQGWRVGAREG